MKQISSESYEVAVTVITEREARGVRSDSIEVADVVWGVERKNEARHSA